MKPKRIAFWLCVCLLITVFSGCNSENVPNESAPSVIAATEQDLSSDAEFETPSKVNPEPVEGTERCHFTVNYLVQDPSGQEEFLEKSAIFSFDLPTEWTFEATPYQVMLYKEGNIIGQIELQSRLEDTNPLFSDIDERGAETYSTKMLTVSGYPAKLYVRKSGAEGTAETKPACSFYIAPDEIPDAYVLIFFLPDAGTEAELETVVSTFHIGE